MNRQSVRYTLWILIFFLVFILFNTWENEKTLTKKIESNDKTSYSTINLSETVNDYFVNDELNEITINTNLISAKINLFGGDITFLSLKEYLESANNAEKKIVILNKTKDKMYFVQSGFFSENIKMNKNPYHSKCTDYTLTENDTHLFVNLEYNLDDKLVLNKIYTFKTYSYDINIDYYITNNSDKNCVGRMYGLINYKRAPSKTSFLNSGMRTYEGGALHTNEKPYKKISFDDLSKKDYSYTVNGGWMAFLESYFLSSWLPDFTYNYIYTANKKSDDSYLLKYINENEIVVCPGECRHFQSTLFVGPKLKTYLNRLYNGLDLAIDYGIFWPISSPLFLLLSKIFSFVQNWGLSIIFVTIMIKLLFFHLSAISYRSMGKMKKLQPRLNLLKERYKDDKKQFGQAVMDLYKKEKVNPLSGCFPILIQIPVFISLYYVLLESVELRHAPFFLWINDLSSKDAFYILPVIMCITMFIQQKLNPPMQDPLQAKIMMFMPFIFLLIFLQFPSGLILYWIINNILSILQQWIIIKSIPS